MLRGPHQHTTYSSTSCHPSPHITTYSPRFPTSSSIPMSFLLSPLIFLLPGTPRHPPSSFTHLRIRLFFILLYCKLEPNPVNPPPDTISSPLGIRVKAMPGGVGISLSPYHSCFLLLPACLIKLLPSAMHTQAYFSIIFPHFFLHLLFLPSKTCFLYCLYVPASHWLCKKHPRLHSNWQQYMCLHNYVCVSVSWWLCLHLHVCACESIAATMAAAAVSS